MNSRKTDAAVVATAAKIAIIKDKVYQTLKIKLFRRHSFMHGVGRDMKMESFVICSVDIKVGSGYYPPEIYVAPIDDEKLFELSFQHRNNIVID